MAQSRKLKGLSTDLHEIFVGSPLWMGIPLWMALPQRITGTTPPAVRFSQYTWAFLYGWPFLSALLEPLRRQFAFLNIPFRTGRHPAIPCGGHILRFIAVTDSDKT